MLHGITTCARDKGASKDSFVIYLMLIGYFPMSRTQEVHPKGKDITGLEKLNYSESSVKIPSSYWDSSRGNS